jgi:hypothetical protein
LGFSWALDGSGARSSRNASAAVRFMDDLQGSVIIGYGWSAVRNSPALAKGVD